MEKKVNKLKLKNDINDAPIESQLEGIMNTIKKDKIQNGIMPKTAGISIMNFAGKVLSKGKSCYVNGNQYFINAGTAWEDIDNFHRRHIAFTDDDFEIKKGD